MNKILLLVLLGLVSICSVSFGAENKPVTLDDIAKLTKTVPHDSGELYEVKIEGIGTIYLKAKDGYESKNIFGKDFIYPTQFEAPKTTSQKNLLATPSFPKSFITTSIGYDVELRAKRVGSLIYLFGNVGRKDFLCFKSGVGELSGEIVSNDRCKTLTKNATNQPVFQTVSSGFVLSALPGKTYEIPIWNGKKFVNKKVTVTAITPKKSRS